MATTACRRRRPALKVDGVLVPGAGEARDEHATRRARHDLLDGGREVELARQARPRLARVRHAVMLHQEARTGMYVYETAKGAPRHGDDCRSLMLT